MIQTIDQLDDILSEPPGYVVDLLGRLEGDILVLGAAGKMGPTLARMARRAADAAGSSRQVIAVSRFSSLAEQQKLEAWNIQTLRGDLLDESFLASLPAAPNVVYMAGMKFGSTGNESLTWAMNSHLPAMVCRKFKGSRIAAFSTGNVYGLTSAVLGGSLETDPLQAVGDYAMSCVGRERMFEHFSRVDGTPVAMLRLNYACELRYGVLVDLAKKIWAGEPVDLSMGCFNVIWQGDANAMSLASLAHAQSPSRPINLAGPELVSVRRVSEQIGERLGKAPLFVGAESADAILSNGQLAHRLFGYPRVPLQQMVEWIAAWVKEGGSSLGKPTHFEARDGKF